jgi:signal transduction histidine kinase
MAILSEVVKQQLGEKSKLSAPMLTEIADSARGLVDSMSDIVWAIDPRRDNLSNVVTRVRQFASDVLEAKKIRWEFQVPPEIDDLKLDAEQRRHVFLIFKEAINNIARHADCRSVSMKIGLAHHQLVAEVQDDGSGFVVQQNGQQGTTNGGGGHGLKNMHRRAAQLGGRFSVHSSPGRGTHLKLIVPL